MVINAVNYCLLDLMKFVLERENIYEILKVEFTIYKLEINFCESLLMINSFTVHRNSISFQARTS